VHESKSGWHTTAHRCGVNQELYFASQDNVLSSSDANVMSAQAAIDAGADVNYSFNCTSCLMVASYQGHAQMVALLLNASANKEAKGEHGATVLLLSAQKGYAECVDSLLNAGANKEAKGVFGFTALLIAG
jgi:ankyrin repeat protein